MLKRGFLNFSFPDKILSKVSPKLLFSLLLLTFSAWYFPGFFYAYKSIYHYSFLLFFFIFFFLYVKKINREENFDFLEYFLDLSKKKYLFFAIIFLHIVLLVYLFTLKYLNFHFGLWDIGIYHSYLLNALEGNIFNYNMQVHAWADHFTPSFLFLVFPFYYLKKSIIWLVVLKIFLLSITPILFYLIAKEVFPDKDERNKILVLTLFLSLMWFITYRPINSAFYSAYQPSSLTPPFILLAFWLYLKKYKISFWLIMIFLLGFKENLAVVWMGFGLYFYFYEGKKRLGLVTFLIGTFCLFFIIFFLMPYFRNYLPSWSTPLGPTKFIFEKFFYLIKVLSPLAFLPLLNWRIGIMALPALGINLSAGRYNLISTGYHYDDVPTSLLFIALILIFREKNPFPPSWVKTNKRKQLLFLFSLTVTFLFLTENKSITYRIEKQIQDQRPFHQAMREDLKEVNLLPSDTKVYTMDFLTAYINLKYTTTHVAIADYGAENCKYHKLPQGSYYVLHPQIRQSYNATDMRSCVINTLKDKENFEVIKGYKELVVLKAR